MNILHNYPRPFCEEEGGGGATPTLSELITQLDGYSLDEILAESKGLQSQFDKKITASNETVRKKTEDKVKAMYDDKLTEQEKLAKMNEVEKAQYEFQKKLDALDKREKEVARKELKSEALSTLREKGIPDWAIGSVNLESAETIKTSVEALEENWSATRQSVVDEAFKKLDTTIKDSQTEGEQKEVSPLEAKINKYTKGN